MPDNYNFWDMCFSWLRNRKEKQRQDRLEINEDIPDVLCNDTQLQLRKRKKGYTRPAVQKNSIVEWTEEEQHTIQQLSSLFTNRFRESPINPVIIGTRLTGNASMMAPKTGQTTNSMDYKKTKKVRFTRQTHSPSEVNIRHRNGPNKRKKTARKK